MKFLAQQKVKKGQPLTDEESEALREKRDRISKKDLEEALANTKGAKGKPAAPAKPDPKKGAKPAEKEKTITQEEEVKIPERPLPDPEQHVNAKIVEFLHHLYAPRLIKIECDNP